MKAWWSDHNRLSAYFSARTPDSIGNSCLKLSYKFRLELFQSAYYVQAAVKLTKR